MAEQAHKNWYNNIHSLLRNDILGVGTFLAAPCV